jgi:DDE superfamily endonuclease
LLVLDGTECLINRSYNYYTQKGYYTKMSKTHCIKYEIGVNSHTGELVWIAGPVPGSVHDLILTQLFSLLNQIGNNKLVLTDKRYIDEWKILHYSKASPKIYLVFNCSSINGLEVYTGLLSTCFCELKYFVVLMRSGVIGGIYMGLYFLLYVKL